MLGSDLYQISFVLNLADSMSGPLGQANEALGGFEGRLLSIHQASQKMLMTGNVMSQIGNSMLGPMDSSIDKMVEFQDAIVGVKKTTGIEGDALNIFSQSGGELAELSQEILVLSTRIPGGAKGLAEITETAGQLGIKGTENLIKFTETVGKMVGVSDLARDQAASNFAQISNVFKLDIAQDLTGLGSVINAVSNDTTAKAAYVTDAMTRIGRVVQSLDYSQVAGLSGALSDIGIRAEIGSTAAKSAFMDMQIKVAQFAQFMGTSEDIWKIRVQSDAMSAFQNVLTKINDLPLENQAEAITRLFGRGAGEVQTIQGLAGNLDLLSKNLEIARIQMQLQTSLDEEFNDSMQSIKMQQDLLVGNYNLISITIGGLFIPVLQVANSVMAGVAVFLQEFIEEHQTLAKIIIFTTAGIGGFLVIVGGGLATIGALGIAISSGIGVLVKLSRILRIAAAAQMLFNVALWMNPITWVVIGIVAVIGVIIYFREEIFKTIRAIGEFFGLVDKETTKTENKLDKLAKPAMSVPSTPAVSPAAISAPAMGSSVPTASASAPVAVQYVPVSLPRFSTQTAGGLSSFRSDSDFGGKSLFEIKVSAPIEFNLNGIALENVDSRAGNVGSRFKQMVEEVFVEVLDKALVKKGLGRA